MLSKTLADGLAEYRIGPKVRELRLKKGLGQVELAKHTDLSPALLSKIERGQLFPTLPTLLRIAMVFGVGLGHFFREDERPQITVTRRPDRLRLPDVSGASAPSYYFESLDFSSTERPMSAYYAEFPRNDRASEAHQHGGRELIYVLSGELALGMQNREMRLSPGDAATFQSSNSHTYRGCAAEGTSALVIVVT